jgi:nitroimidazol reductase NimA-like FMN-containing flavoprotein (pyridoxamine 5'-phosphate oxidase superfamily)
VHEIDADLQWLQGLLDASIEQAGPFLRSSMGLDERSLTPRQVVRHLDGVRTVSLATVTARGEPRVAPVVAIFLRGHYYVPTVVKSARARHLRQRPALSLTDYDGVDMAVIIHGRATLLGLDDKDFDGIDELFTNVSDGDGPRTWEGGGPLYIRVDPDVMYASALEPTNYPA